MATSGADYLRQVKERITEVDPQVVQDLLQAGTDDAVVIDVREQQEWDESHIPGAKHVPRGFLETRIDGATKDRSQRVVLYCASGNRSALAAATLIDELGYENVESMAGGITLWKQRNLPIEVPFQYSDAQRIRYSRHMLLPEVGAKGQQQLLESKVLLLGAGGLGAPVALYLAAAGIGTLGIVDDDVVDASNLQRQVIHTTDRVGEPKVDSAEVTIRALNPDVKVVKYNTRINASNIMEIIADYDIIVDGVDNFPTRYLLNDATVRTGKTVVSASILAFDGQLTVFKPYDGPCYRCLYPEPPPPELAPSCGENGVLGVLPGTMGLLQATEVIKLILNIGEPLIGRLLLYDALESAFTTLKIQRDPECPICSREPGSISDEEMGKFPDYEAFCTGITIAG
ncbi:MAG: molybdopterin-synthase adenylyltransferase MoeB [Thermoleophilaceae bacterium]|nr:molybdopterin-synthase adenylyltransferase MoeB [Thermoleophilaceae bacterium]